MEREYFTCLLYAVILKHLVMRCYLHELGSKQLLKNQVFRDSEKDELGRDIIEDAV